MQTVLIAVSDPGLRQLLTEGLMVEGMRPRTLSDVRHMDVVISAVHSDVAVIGMPSADEPNAIDVARSIRRWVPGVPLVALALSPEDRACAEAADLFVTIIDLPLDVDTVVSALHKAIADAA